MRIFSNEIEIIDQDGLTLRRHEIAKYKGEIKILNEERIFNPTRETTKLLERVGKIGPRAAELGSKAFLTLGRSGKGVLYGLSNLTRDYRKEDIEAASDRVLKAGSISYKAVKRLLERVTKKSELAKTDLKQSGSEIRPINDYQTFWEINSQTNTEEKKNGNDYH